MKIDAADGADLEPILALLRSADLPVADIEPGLLVNFVLARDGEHIAGVGGLEIHGRSGLLRSLAVAPAHRGRGLGEALVHAIEARARLLGIESLTLLTTAAAPFFARLGYRTIDRRSAPEAVRGTAEFSRLCPASATCLSKEVQP